MRTANTDMHHVVNSLAGIALVVPRADVLNQFVQAGFGYALVLARMRVPWARRLAGPGAELGDFLRR